jgi:hypothetical protein
MGTEIMLRNDDEWLKIKHVSECRTYAYTETGVPVNMSMIKAYSNWNNKIGRTEFALVD